MLKAYSFQNMYLTGIQSVIQTTHSIAELVYTHSDAQEIAAWTMVNRTLVILNGGDSANLKLLKDTLQQTSKDFAFWASTNEVGLDDALVNVSVVLSEKAQHHLNEMTTNKPLLIRKSANSLCINQECYEIYYYARNGNGDYPVVLTSLLVSKADAELLIKIKSGRVLK